MTLNRATIEHIRDLAKLREDEGLSRFDTIELFDSIDSMDMEELCSLYALVHLGLSGNQRDYTELMGEAQSKGFCIVDELFELVNLGSAIQHGYEKEK